MFQKKSCTLKYLKLIENTFNPEVSTFYPERKSICSKIKPDKSKSSKSILFAIFFIYRSFSTHLRIETPGAKITGLILTVCSSLVNVVTVPDSIRIEYKRDCTCSQENDRVSKDVSA